MEYLIILGLVTGIICVLCKHIAKQNLEIIEKDNKILMQDITYTDYTHYVAKENNKTQTQYLIYEQEIEKQTRLKVKYWNKLQSNK